MSSAAVREKQKRHAAWSVLSALWEQQ